MSDIEQRAAAFAAWQHNAINQRRKYTGEPYINHPAAVAEIVRSVPHTEEMLAAAWLHDTVEDTGATIIDIQVEFGLEVASLVEQITDVSCPSDGNRKTRKALDRDHIAKASPQAKTIKLADLIDNSASIVAHDPEFAKVYLEEKAALLEVLREGDPGLWKCANAIVQNAKS
jgi:(p)ppGpp synthase/HD superfamily hydrolase